MTSSRAPARPSRPRGARRLFTAGWLPDQHGAWPMALLPALTGIVAGGPRPLALLLLGACFGGFSAFHAMSLFTRLAERRRHAVTPALVTWSAIAIGTGVPLIVLSPALLRWSPFFAPLALGAIVEALRGRPRSLTSRVSTILAACLMTPVAWSLGAHADHPLAPELGQAWLIAALEAAYFLGTVPYVRSMIRGRGELRWIVASGTWHAAGFTLIALAAWNGIIHPGLALVWAGLLVRSIGLPLAVRAGRTIRPMTIGLLEMACTTAVWVFLLLGM